MANLVRDHIQAGFGLLWVHTSEPDRAIRDLGKEIKSLAADKKQNIEIAEWDCVSGFRDESGVKPMEDPLMPLKRFDSMPDRSVLFLHNYHRCLGSLDAVQTFANRLDAWRGKGKTVIVISPVINLPVEIEKLWTIIDFKLPDREKVREVVEYIAESAKLKSPPKDPELSTIVENGLGLTQCELENALAYSLIRAGKFDPKIISEMKSQMVKKSGILEYAKFNEKFDSLAGMDAIKKFALATALHALSRGILIVGVPGCGKSHFAKALGNEIGLPVLTLDFGRIFGSFIGESEGKMRATTDMLDAMAPCVCFIDEIEKGLAGSESSGRLDSGVTSRVTGGFLTWLNDHTSRVYMVASCNDLDSLPPPFQRAERWDAIFFVDLPSENERIAILEIYRKHFEIKDKSVPDMTDFSGAEIKTMCRISKMIGIPLTEARQYVIPLSRSMGEKITKLRNWAVDRALMASTDATVRTREKRRIDMNPTAN
jgi:AAA+ superfamily predicted ATPase